MRGIISFQIYPQIILAIPPLNEKGVLPAWSADIIFFQRGYCQRYLRIHLISCGGTARMICKWFLYLLEWGVLPAWSADTFNFQGGYYQNDLQMVSFPVRMRGTASVICGYIQFAEGVLPEWSADTLNYQGGTARVICGHIQFATGYCHHHLQKFFADKAGSTPPGIWMYPQITLAVRVCTNYSPSRHYRYFRKYE